MRISSETNMRMELYNHRFNIALWGCRFLGVVPPLIGVAIIVLARAGIAGWILGIGLILGVFVLNSSNPRNCTLDLESMKMVVVHQKAFQKAMESMYDLDQLAFISIGRDLNLGFYPKQVVWLAGDTPERLVETARRIQAFLPHEVDVI